MLFHQLASAGKLTGEVDYIFKQDLALTHYVIVRLIDIYTVHLKAKLINCFLSQSTTEIIHILPTSGERDL